MVLINDNCPRVNLYHIFSLLLYPRFALYMILKLQNLILQACQKGTTSIQCDPTVNEPLHRKRDTMKVSNFGTVSRFNIECNDQSCGHLILNLPIENVEDFYVLFPAGRM